MKKNIFYHFRRLVPVVVLIVIVVLAIGAPVSANHAIVYEGVTKPGGIGSPTSECQNYVTGNPVNDTNPTRLVGVKYQGLGEGVFYATMDGVDWYLWVLDADNAADGTTYFEITFIGNASNFNEVTEFEWWTSGGVGIDYVLVKAGSGATDAGTNVYAYTHLSPEPSSDIGLKTPQNKTLSHVTFCYDFEFIVTKEGTPFFTRTNNWDITKTVNPASWTIFEGDTAEFDWTVVVDKLAPTDSAFYIDYKLTISNPSPLAVNFTIDDPALVGAVDVPDDGFPFCGDVSSLAAEGTVTCGYRVSFGDTEPAEPVVNEVTVSEDNNQIGDGTASTSVSFDEPTTVLHAEVTFSDSLQRPYDTFNATNNFQTAPYTVSDDTTFTWSQPLFCDNPDDEGTHINTASISSTNGLSDQASATGTLECQEISVTKYAEPTFTRTFDWTIDKSVLQDWVIFEGDTAEFDWTVTATKGVGADDNFAVSGVITVSNPAGNSRDAVINSVTDQIVDGNSLTVGTCYSNAELTSVATLPATVAPGAALYCKYSGSVDGAEDGSQYTNEGTAVQQNYNYTINGQTVTPTAGDTTSYSGTALFTFSNPTLVNDSVTLSDILDKPNADPTDITGLFGGNATVDETTTWTYTQELACNADEGAHVNTATITAEGLDPGDSDGDNNEDSKSASATGNLACEELLVSKTVDTSYELDWDWTIEKNASFNDTLAGLLSSVDNVETLDDLTDEILNLTMASGQPNFANPVEFDITLTAASSPLNYAVEGVITVTNPTEDTTALVDSVVDDISGVDNDPMPVCYASMDDLEAETGALTAPYTLEGGASIYCAYSSNLENGEPRTNKATANLQNHDYSVAVVGEDVVVTKTPIDGKTTPFMSDVVDVIFTENDIVHEYDTCINVTDDYPEFAETHGDTNGDVIVCLDELNDTYTLTLSYDVFDFDVFDCGIEYEFVNVARFVSTTADDVDEDTGSDKVTVVISVPCTGTCSLTPGYWKTHSDQGPAPFDAAWYLNAESVPVGAPEPKIAEFGNMPTIHWDGNIDGMVNAPTTATIPGVNGPETPFPAGIATQWTYTQGRGRQATSIDVTYLTAMTTAPQGNSYFNLSNHFAAAHLNIQNGADYSLILQDFLEAYELLQLYSPNNVDTLRGKTGSDVRARFIYLAGRLGAFNEGDLNPAGHCND